MPIPLPNFLSRNKTPKQIDPKPLTVTVELADGQWRTWKLGPGDGVGLGGYRIDVQGPNAVLVSQYAENSQQDFWCGQNTPEICGTQCGRCHLEHPPY